MADVRGLRRVARVLRDLRVVWWFVAALLALFAADKARATTYGPTGYTQYQALQHCQSIGGAVNTGPHPGYGLWETCGGPYSDSGGNYYMTIGNNLFNLYKFTGSVVTCTPPQVLLSSNTCGAVPKTAAQCEAEPEIFGGYQFPQGALVCIGGCRRAVSNLGDGGEILLATEPLAGLGSAFQTCDPSAFSCPTGYTDADDANSLLGYCMPDAGDADGDGIPNSTDPTPTEHGEVPRDTDGDGTPDAQDPFPNDPDNGKDKEDGETVNTSTGGGNCSSPPESHGDAIGAQIAYQAWHTRCAVERLGKTMKDGTAQVTVASVGIGGGLSEGESEALTAIKDNTDNLNGTASFGDVQSSIPGEGVTAADAFGTPSVETGIGTGFDDSGWLTAARECPNLPTVTMPEWIGGAVIELDDPFVGFCTLMSYAGMFVWLFAALASIKIYSKVI